MAGPYDPADSRLRVSTTSGGTYNVVGKVIAWEHNEGEEGGSTIRWMGGEARLAGDGTVSGNCRVVLDLADTTGQDVLKAAKRSGDDVFIQVCPEGAGAGKEVEQFKAKVSEYSISSDVGSDYVEARIAYNGDHSTLTSVTLS